LVDEAAGDRAALDPLVGEVGDRFAGPGRAELAAAMGRRRLSWAAYPARTGRRWHSLNISIGPVAWFRAVSTKRSAWAFARGLRGGIFTASIPAAVRTVPEDAVNCPARPRTGNREPEVCGAAAEADQEAADLLGSSPGSVRVGGDREDVPVTGASLDDEQAVQPPEGHCAVHVEEVGGEHGRGLRVQELPPVVAVCRFGAGWIRSALRTRPIVDALTRWLGLSSSPWMRWYPQPLFSVASRPVVAAISALTGGRPVRCG
jgi:hypothetical protein